MKDLRELLQALALGIVLTLQTLKVGANLSQLQLHLGIATRHDTCSINVMFYHGKHSNVHSLWKQYFGR